MNTNHRSNGWPELKQPPRLRPTRSQAERVEQTLEAATQALMTAAGVRLATSTSSDPPES
jgi:hypothetical protein